MCKRFRLSASCIHREAYNAQDEDALRTEPSVVRNPPAARPNQLTKRSTCAAERAPSFLEILTEDGDEGDAAAAFAAADDDDKDSDGGGGRLGRRL